MNDSLPMAGDFRHLKVGDIVVRRIGVGKAIDMDMVVVHVDDHLIYCDKHPERVMKGLPLKDHWTFDRDIGCEEDEDLEWGKKYGITGSYLIIRTVSLN